MRRGGDGGYMVIMQVPRDSYAGYRQRVADLGIRLVSEPGPERCAAWACSSIRRTCLAPSRNCAGTSTRNARTATGWPAGEDWQRAKRTEIVDGIRARRDPDGRSGRAGPRAGARSWTSRSAAGDVPTIALRDAEIRFVPLRDGRPEGLGGLDIRVRDRARALANAEAAGCRTGDDLVTICGMRLRLV